MSKLLDSAAVGVRKGEDAHEILAAYIKTGPSMVLNMADPQASVRQQPQGTGLGDELIKP